MTYPLTIIQHNSQSLRAVENKCLYEEQFIAMSINIIGLQETRTPHTCVQLSSHKKQYIIASSSVINHQYGNELWISHK